ncbi:MAG: PulJ/GspJ family protein [Bryobacteraceae bacterium]
MKRQSDRERGVTLIELTVAITLVAALAGGMLMAMRAGLMTLEKTDARLDSNRRVVGARRILLDELGGVMPVTGTCDGGLVPAFNGNSQTLHLVSSDSMAEGARGAPRVVELQVVPSGGGTVRLIANEFRYAGPSSIAPFCGNGIFIEGKVRPDSLVLADHLAYCRFEYQQIEPSLRVPADWVPDWTHQPNLPAAIRIDMRQATPDPASLPLLSLTLPIHVTRDVLGLYLDARQ